MEVGKKSKFSIIKEEFGGFEAYWGIIPTKSRIILARGLIISMLSYLISMWGGTMVNYKRKTQTLLNEAARWATGMQRRTKISTLMEVTGWNTIQEMTELSSAKIIWKILYRNTPRNIYVKLNINRTENKIIIIEQML